MSAFHRHVSAMKVGAVKAPRKADMTLMTSRLSTQLLDAWWGKEKAARNNLFYILAAVDVYPELPSRFRTPYHQVGNGRALPIVNATS